MKRLGVVGAWAVVCAFGLSVGAVGAQAQDGDGEPDEPQEDVEEGENPPDAPPAGEEPAPAPTEEPAPAPTGEEPAPAPTGEPAPTPAAGGAVEFPAEVTALFPAELLRELPATMLRYLTLQDYQKLRATCPQELGEELVKCLTAESTLEQLTRLYVRSVIRTVMGYMDLALPPRLSDADIDEVTEACMAAVAPWADCTFEKGPDHADCAEAEDLLALCIGDDEDVNATLLELQDDKKAAWGDAGQYVELRGLFSYFDLAEMKQVRATCNQSDGAALLQCLDGHELTGPLMKEFEKLAQELVAEAVTELGAAGKPVDEAQAKAWYERTLSLFLTFPSRAVASVAADCEKQHPELATLKDAADFDKSLSCLELGAAKDPVANPIYVSPEKLKGWLELGRAKVEDAVRKKEAAAQDRSFGYVLIILGILAGLGAIVVLLMPLALKKKYPTAKGLWGSSALAAGVLVLSIAVLGGALLVMRTVQGKVGTDTTSPKMRIADAAFSVLEKDDYVAFFSELSTWRLDLAKTPLRELSADLQATAGVSEEERTEAVAAVLALHWAKLLEQPEIARMAKNMATLKEQVGVYRGLIGFMKSLDGVLGYVPILLALLAVLLYLLPLRETLIQIASAPARAARGEASGTGEGLRSVGSEVKGLFPYLGLVLVLLPLTGLFIGLAVEPAMEVVINVSLLNFFYLLGADASGFPLQASIIGGLLLLILVVLTYILAVVFYAGTFRKIMRAHFHEGRKFSEFKRFWTWGTASLLFVLVFPALFAMLARFAQQTMLANEDKDLTGLDLWLIPLVGVLGFLVLFWAARGLKALKEIKAFPKAS